MKYGKGTGRGEKAGRKERGIGVLVLVLVFDLIISRVIPIELLFEFEF